MYYRYMTSDFKEILYTIKYNKDYTILQNIGTIQWHATL